MHFLPHSVLLLLWVRDLALGPSSHHLFFIYPSQLRGPCSQSRVSLTIFPKNNPRILDTQKFQVQFSQPGANFFVQRCTFKSFGLIPHGWEHCRPTLSFCRWPLDPLGSASHLPLMMTSAAYRRMDGRMLRVLHNLLRTISHTECGRRLNDRPRRIDEHASLGLGKNNGARQVS